MAQRMIDLREEKHPGSFCTKICKSEAGLMCHINRKHPLDAPSGLTCYTCNKNFSQRDLIENHYKTVKHQLECKKLREEEVVEMTLLEENRDEYRQKLLKMNNFRARPYTPRTWQSMETLEIPLESDETLQDPRINTCKHALSTQMEEEPNKKTQKTCIEEDPPQTRSIPKIGESPCAAGFVGKILGEDSTRKPESSIAEKSSFLAEDKKLKKIQVEKDHTNQPKGAPIDTSFVINFTLPHLDTLQEFEGNLKEESSQKKIGNTFQESTYSASVEDEGITLHVSDSDLKLFPVEEECSNIEDCTEKRTVKLSNEWIVKDTVGKPAFEGLIEEDPNIDWLTFISDTLSIINHHFLLITPIINFDSMKPKVSFHKSQNLPHLAFLTNLPKLCKFNHMTISNQLDH